MPDGPDIKYSISGLVNKVLDFECPHCHVALSSPLTDAGKADNCPVCGSSFVTPGRETLDLHAAIEGQKKAEREAKLEQKRQNTAKRAAEKKAQRAQKLADEQRLRQQRAAEYEASKPRVCGDYFIYNRVTYAIAGIVSAHPFVHTGFLGDKTYVVELNDAFGNGLQIQFKTVEEANRFMQELANVKGNLPIVRDQIQWWIGISG